MNVSGSLSRTAQATLLLTSYFSKASRDDAKPLTIKEWSKFALWLKEKNVSPGDLLGTEAGALLNGWHDSRISAARITELLHRGHALALAMEKWQRAGLWVVTRSDPEYPKRLKQRLKTDSPPVLFGCGNKALLNSGGLAVIGSRNASDEDLFYTERVGAKAVIEGVAIVSGGARGVDETAMLGAMPQGGVVIGVLADSLFKAATSAKWRQGLMRGNVVLVSPFYPEAGFNAGNAMARNKYIYCLADSALVIHSGKKGGTINGAEENLKNAWVPLWVKPTDDQDAANADLVVKGGEWCSDDCHNLSISDLLKHSENKAMQTKERSLELFPEQPELFSQSSFAVREQEVVFTQEQVEHSTVEKEFIAQDTSSVDDVDFYQFFTLKLQRLATSAITLDELIENTGLHKSQLNEWLKKAVDEGVVKKLNRPVRYQVQVKL